MNSKVIPGSARHASLWVGVHLVWGCALWQSISKYGLGVSTDAVHYMFAGLNLAAGRGLTLFGGAPYAQWPPLYPVALAGIHALTGWDMLASAEALQWLTWILISICISSLCWRIFPNRPWLAWTAAALSQIGTVMIFAFQSVGSDYLHLLFVLLFTWQAGNYLRRPTPATLTGMILFAALGTLTRYTGVTMLAMGALIFFWKPEGTLWQRIMRSLWMGVAVLPTAIWYAAVLEDRAPGRPPVSFLENLRTFTLSILGWWIQIPDSKIAQIPFVILFWIVVAGAGAWLARRWKTRRQINPYALALPGYGFLYAVTLFVVAMLAYFNKLSDRFLLPLYVPVIVFLLIGVDKFLDGKRRNPRIQQLAGVSSIALLSVPLALFAFGSITVSQARGVAAGNLFNTTAWHENSVLRYWEENTPQADFIVYANSPAGVAFHTWENVLGSPRKFAGPFSDALMPIPADLIPPGMEVYLIWIEPSEYSHLYTRDELGESFQLTPLYESADGGVYRLSAR